MYSKTLSLTTALLAAGSAMSASVATTTTPLNIPQVAQDFLNYVENYGADGGVVEDFLRYKIVNGTKMPVNVPWFASINIIQDVQPDGSASVGLCGGSLINSEYVLTAAHCFFNTDNGQYVRPATVQLGTGGQVVPNVIIQVGGLERMLTRNSNAPSATPYMFRAGGQVICHPEYNAEQQINDICLIKLNNPSTNNPVRLNFVGNANRTAAEVQANQAAGVQATALGFGDLAYQGSTSPVLMKTTMPIVPQDVCRQTWNYVFTGNASSGPGDTLISDKVLCADSTQSDTCQGDSGGPLVNVRAGVLIGLTSMGIDCASGVPGVYTKISAFQDWITQTAGKTY